MRSKRIVAGVFVAIALAAGCARTAGRATPDVGAPGAPTPGSPDSAPTSAAVALPARPRVIELTGTGAPCQLLTPAQQRQFGMNRFLPEEDTGFGHPGCTFEHDATSPRYGFTVTPKPDLDARRLLTTEFGRKARVVTAASFPAVESRPGLTGQSNISCFINVDVADGQSLEVQSLLITTKAFTADEMCEKTRQVAEAAMTTLLSRQ